MLRLLTILIVLLITLNPLAHADKLTIYTENSPPGNFVNAQGDLTGLSVEIVKAIQGKLNQPGKIHLVPWARGYRIISSTPNTMLFSTTRTPEREALFQWVGPLFEVKWLLVARKDSPLIIHSLDDAKKLGQIGTYRHDVRERYLEELGFTNLHSVNKALQLPRLLERGRIDAFITTNIAMSRQELGQIQKPGEVFRIIYEFKRFPLYMAFSRQTPEASVKEWQQAFDKLLEQGKIQDIRNRWFELPFTDNKDPARSQ
ncbi:substrate-binding periplasmic protein [Dongshaea marina]|uniref:substrate-binding periplasmic protein n=1 Tax=Dongshaea marina TaxID=2047966 RepID=UPI000D3E2047|nr:ABC transporter substrate-binding protein [Dongshaea marina]